VVDTVTVTISHDGLEEVRLIVFDFDGVMTDNHVLVLQDGSEAVYCNRADGQGVGMIRKQGIDMLILSTEVNLVVTARAAKLNLEVIHACTDKATVIRQILAERCLDPRQVMFVGNDTNDLPAMRLVGWPVAPADAHPTVLAHARFVTKAIGGGGVVREIADMVCGGVV
jgi:YrbI family 3-deoxy-D-manno-octulosonate 8-phosphate phosphatase